MHKYSKAALITVEACASNLHLNLDDEWDKAIKTLGVSDKSCPKLAFKGLCSEGMVKGINPDRCLFKRESKNKNYAVKAANLLLTGHEADAKTLWGNVIHEKKAHNGQMFIVINLYNAGLLQKSNKSAE
ncbi:DUF6979 family protein [Tatumella morbirosei]|uniref:DUF6979 family protein n=1 Tax=Tatumella morbirosei TaxID=642227 RepID=UPI00069AFC99|nr:hypothetical protein [Tatumella morbirosei]